MQRKRGERARAQAGRQAGAVRKNRNTELSGRAVCERTRPPRRSGQAQAQARVNACVMGVLAESRSAAVRAKERQPRKRGEGAYEEDGPRLAPNRPRTLLIADAPPLLSAEKEDRPLLERLTEDGAPAA